MWFAAAGTPEPDRWPLLMTNVCIIVSVLVCGSVAELALSQFYILINKIVKKSENI